MNLNLFSVIGNEDTRKKREKLIELFKINPGKIGCKVLKLTVVQGYRKTFFEPNTKIKIKNIRKFSFYLKRILRGQVNSILNIEELKS